MKYVRASQVIRELRRLRNPAKEAFLPRFFKTGKGEYGEGDMFWGVSVPNERAIANKFLALSIDEITLLLRNPIHDVRQTALFILTYQWKKADVKNKKMIYDMYIANIRYVNNWDLVDCSAAIIVGGYLRENREKRKILYRFARSKSLWERRIAMIATWAFLRESGETKDMVAIATILLSDKHDLIHKAVGWMLREMGKVNEKELYSFLDEHASRMPRTMLRYSVERLDPERRKMYV